MKKFGVGDTVRVKLEYGKVIYAIIRGEYGNWFLVESLNSDGFQSMGKQHTKWVRKTNILATN